MDLPLCLSTIEATDTGYTGDMSENGFYPPETHTLGNNQHESDNGIARQNHPKSLSLPAITDSEVNVEVRNTIVEWRGTRARARRNTEEEKRQTWRRSLNSPIQKFFWTDIVVREQNRDGDMSVDAILEENAVCDEADLEECMFISRDEDGHPVFSPAIHAAARQAENEEAVEGNFVDSQEDTPMDDLESKGGNETTDSENTTEQEHLAERIQVLSIQGV